MASMGVEDRGYITRNLNICLITFSSLFVALRCYVRRFMLDSMGWDDAFAIVAWVILVAQSSLELDELNYGSGRHMKDVPSEDLTRFFSIIPTLELLYFAATCFVRLSVVAVLPRISREKKVMWTVWALGFVIIVMSVVCFFVLLFECKHVPDLWNRLSPTARCVAPQQESYLFWAHAAIGICVDVVLLVIPIWLIYSRMMHSMAALKVILVFGFGFFVLVTGIVRLVIIVSVDYGVDTTWQWAKLSLWADLEGHVGLWIACFPSIQPIIRLAAKKIGLTSKTTSSDGVAANNNNNNNNDNDSWEHKPRGYVTSAPEVRLAADSGSIFDDDSSTKKIITVDERDIGMEMGRVHMKKGR